MNYIHYDLEGNKPNPYETFSLQFEKEILLQRRKKLGLTQKQVSDKAGIQLRQYQRFEMGERNISSSSARIMLSVCEALSLDPYIFMGKANEEANKVRLILPPIEKSGYEYAIPQYAYFLFVSAIPKGMLCTDNDIMTCLRKVYGNDALEIKTDKNSVYLYLNNLFPYWRVVSQRGHLINNLYCGKEKQKELLINEGFSIKKMNRDSFVVEDYKTHLYDLDNLQITILKSEKDINDEFGIGMYQKLKCSENI